MTSEICNEPRPDHAAYVASWIKVLNGDKRAIFTAAKVQEAADFAHNLQPQPPGEPEPEEEPTILAPSKAGQFSLSF